jgi:phosphatidylserine/phosphatidylglycerophosphate/cardiolipin synthase-like enzyme
MLSLIFCAGQAHALFRVPGLELVYSYPDGSSLSEPDLRQAKDVWPEMFDQAQKSIDIEHFYLTPHSGESLDLTLAALERAAKRGVKIRVILEKQFDWNSVDGVNYLLAIPHLQLKIVDWTKLTGKGIVHAKFFTVDGRLAYIGSQNLDWRSLTHNHELGLAIDDSAAVMQTQSLFDHDWRIAGSSTTVPVDQDSRPTHDRDARLTIVASPWAYNPTGVGDSESELIRLIRGAKKEIFIQNLKYVPVSSKKTLRYYGAIDSALRDALVRKVQIRLLVSDWSTEEPGIKGLQSLSIMPGMDARIITIPQAAVGPIPFARVAHSKYAVIDGKTVWLGTSNWVGGYLDDSRNIEVIVKDSNLAKRISELHDHLWQSAYTEKIDPLKTYSKPIRYR